MQIVLHGLEGGLDLDQLDVELPQLGRVFPTEIGTQEITTFAPPNLAQLVAIEGEAKRGAVASHLDIDQTPCRSRLGARGTELHEQFLTLKLHVRYLFEARP